MIRFSLGLVCTNHVCHAFSSFSCVVYIKAYIQSLDQFSDTIYHVPYLELIFDNWRVSGRPRPLRFPDTDQCYICFNILRNCEVKMTGWLPSPLILHFRLGPSKHEKKAGGHCSRFLTVWIKSNLGYPIDGIGNRWQSISIDTNRYQLIDWYW